MVGGLLLKTLLEAPDYTRVYALTRRPYGKEHPKLANKHGPTTPARGVR